jgi:poly(A) RNA polymerase GLD2
VASVIREADISKMFPAHNFGFKFGSNSGPNQTSGHGSGVRFQQPMNLLPRTVGGFGDGHMNMAPFGMVSPRQSLRSTGKLVMPLLGSLGPNQSHQSRDYGTTRGQKRRNDDSPSYPSKQARPSLDKPSSSFVSPQPHPSATVNNFIVPVSHGTEKITMAIWNYFLSASMKDEDLTRKLQLRKCLLSIFNGAFTNCRLFIVGSSMTGFATKNSDVDMCLMLSMNEIDQKKDAVSILNCISKSLKQLSSVQNLRVIRAKVPILKFFDNLVGVECDLNINNLIGVRNTHLLRNYAYADWRIRPLMLFIKKWARFHDINDASKQTISSYTLTLMLIHYLQVGISPPVLPCLQKIRPELFDPKIDVRNLSLRFNNVIDFTSKNRATLGELFLGFLNYYSNVFSFDTEVISVRLGSTLSLRDISGSMQWKHLSVEEPFDRSNTARSVYDKFVFTRVRRVFETSYSILEGSRDVEQILKRPF